MSDKSGQQIPSRRRTEIFLPAAHYCFDHTAFGGLVFPTLRRVVRRPPSGPLVNGPTAVLIQITDVVYA
jgi:hypothetical protein